MTVVSLLSAITLWGAITANALKNIGEMAHFAKVSKRTIIPIPCFSCYCDRD